jgi:hypothetical protein
VEILFSVDVSWKEVGTAAKVLNLYSAQDRRAFDEHGGRCCVVSLQRNGGAGHLTQVPERSFAF